MFYEYFFVRISRRFFFPSLKIRNPFRSTCIFDSCHRLTNTLFARIHFELINFLKDLIPFYRRFLLYFMRSSLNYTVDQMTDQKLYNLINVDEYTN